MDGVGRRRFRAAFRSGPSLEQPRRVRPSGPDVIEQGPEREPDQEEPSERVETTSEAAPEMASRVESNGAQDGCCNSDGEDGENQGSAEHRERDAGGESIDARREGEREQGVDLEHITLGLCGFTFLYVSALERFPEHLAAHGEKDRAGDEVTKASRKGAESRADCPPEQRHSPLEAAEQKRHPQRVPREDPLGRETPGSSDRHRVESESDSEEEDRREGHGGGGPCL
jgi:hypothetical protein